VWLEHGIDIASHAGSVLGHGGAAHDEYISEDTPADKALAKRGEGSLDLRRAKQNVIPVWSRASRSLADR
jgi:hypothetical protein